MSRSRVLGVLIALGVGIGAGFVGSSPASAAPQLSEGCTFMHQFDIDDVVLVSSGKVVIEPRAFAAGEQLRVLAATEDEDVTAQVLITREGHAPVTLTAQRWVGMRYDIDVTGNYGLELSVSPQNQTSWNLSCGIPPTPVILSPAGGQTYAVDQYVPTTYACTAQTYPVDTCRDSTPDLGGSGALDTSQPGSFTYTVTATDTGGLSRTVSIAYTVLQQQRVWFTSVPPTGSDWFFGNFDGFGYVAKATATSDLPVAYSIDPASTGVCRVQGILQDHPWYGTGAAIEFLRAGTCTINADQAGNDGYLPAERVSQSFEIAKVPTWMTAAKAVKGVLGLTPSTFSAKLAVPFYAGGGGWGLEGYPGQLITFSVAGKQVCAAVTNANGVATCKAAIGLANALSQSSYTATYAGDANYKEATAQGKLG